MPQLYTKDVNKSEWMIAHQDVANYPPKKKKIVQKKVEIWKNKKKIEKNTYKIIGIHKYKIYDFKGSLGIKSIKDTLQCHSTYQLQIQNPMYFKFNFVFF